MNPVLNRRMMEVLDELEFRDDVGVLVLSGEGSAWSAGMDLKEYFRETEAKGLGAIRKAQSEAYGWWRRLRWYGKPTIAMVNGWCFGGGYGPLFACDLAFAADEAQFALSEINWGILPGGGATKVVVDLLSMRDAMYHALTGELIDGRKAAAWKLVNESLPLADLKARVTRMREGLEAELPLVVDVMLPSQRLVDAVRAFEAQFPTVTLRLNMEALSAVSQLVQRGMATLGIGGALHTAEVGLETVAVGDVLMIPVARSDHPLAGAEAGIVGAARRHRQLILTVRAAFQQGSDINVFAPQTWPLADLGAKHTLLLAGMGWGYIPEPVVREYIAAGRLVHLDLPEMRSGAYPLQAMYRTDAPPGPAGAWFIQRLLAHAAPSLPR